MKRTRRRSIMVAVRELDTTSRHLLRKAAKLARAHDASLRLVHVIAIPYSPMAAARSEIVRAARAQITERKARLRKLARGRELQGVPTRVDVIWDYPASDAIVRQVLKYKPAMLVAESAQRGRTARMWLTNTDWELMRKCPCPLWLSKANRAIADSKVLAAIDPLHAHAKTASLDNVILRAALDVAEGDADQIVACHCYVLPPISMGGIGIEPYWLPISMEEQRHYETDVRRAVDRTAKRHGIPADNVKTVVGDPATQLPRIVKKTRPRVLVMGAVSRSGLKRLFIGHTAERVIDAVDCDVLIVKPRGFQTDVNKRSAVEFRDFGG